GDGVLRSRACGHRPVPPQARRAPPVERPLSRRAAAGDARSRLVARQRAGRQCRRGGDRSGRQRAPAAPGRGQRSVRALHRRRARRAPIAGLRVLRLGPGCGALRHRLGHARRGRADARPGDRGAVTPGTLGPDRRHALLRPEISVPFLLVALIWGSTWFVIKDQLAAAPPSWSVAYRFVIACAGMFVLAAFGGRGFTMTLSGHLLAVGIGLCQFFLNFNLVYRAELYLTSGIVAVLYAL